ncbi:hypothetical protein O3P69_013719 [Scylla paramamosain]|uniref:Uncharacterized protein n=1 Tax=Scylla paramamosain TaxID=85552 RepID=A0AAW0SPG0_SCYPA
MASSTAPSFRSSTCRKKMGTNLIIGIAGSFPFHTVRPPTFTKDGWHVWPARNEGISSDSDTLKIRHRIALPHTRDSVHIVSKSHTFSRQEHRRHEAAPPPTIPLHQQHVNDGDEYPKFLRDIPSLSSIFRQLRVGMVLPNGTKIELQYEAPATENPLPPLADRPFLRDPQSHCSDSQDKTHIQTLDASYIGDSGEHNREPFSTWSHVTLAAPRLVQVMTLVHERRRFVLRLKSQGICGETYTYSRSTSHALSTRVSRHQARAGGSHVLLVAATSGAPHLAEQDHLATILKHHHTNNGDDHFQYSFESSDGINVQAEGTAEVEGQNICGSLRYPLPSLGTIVEVHYVADEDGYPVEYPIIHSLRSLPSRHQHTHDHDDPLHDPATHDHDPP